MKPEAPREERSRSPAPGEAAPHPAISIEPVWARFFDFGAGRMPSLLTKLAGDAQQVIARNVAELDLVFRRLRAASIWSARDAHWGLLVSLDRPVAR